MNKLPILLSLIFLSFVLMNSCEVENCPPNSLAYAKFSMVNQDGKPVSSTVPTSIIGQVITDVTVYDTLDNGDIIERVVTDSLISDTIINKESNLSTFKVPLSFLDETSFVISYDDGRKDFLKITHKNIPYFMNIDCGTMMFHEVTGVSHSQGIDSVVITNPNIDNYEKENFKIYFTVNDSQ